MKYCVTVLAQALARLSEVSAALEMGPREKALYLKNRAKAAAAAQSDEEVASTLAGSTPAGLRTWIRQVDTTHHLTNPMTLTSMQDALSF